MITLTEVLALDRPDGGVNDYGDPYQGWQEVAQGVRGKIRYLQGGEAVQAARLQGRQPVKITIPTQDAAGLTTDWRIRDLSTGAVYNVRAVVPARNKLFTEITAESGVGV